MKYFSSDWHLGHNNIIQYCSRNYNNLDDMSLSIINIVNTTVKETDELYLIGDLSLNPKWIESAMLLINCKNIHLIMGNHDSCFSYKFGMKKEKTEKMIQRYYRMGFKSIVYTMWLKLNDYDLQLCHFPFLPESESKLNRDTRFLDRRPQNVGQVLLHGHLHKKYQKCGKMIDVGIDGEMKVYSEIDIINLIEDKRDTILSVTKHNNTNIIKDY